MIGDGQLANRETVQDIHNHFCGECGVTLYRTGGDPGMKDNVGLRAGVLDDQNLLDKPPAIEVYVERRPPVSLLLPSITFPGSGLPPPSPVLPP
jgi:hypothetical protein